eukprot:2635490-Karenia_brevis.AAC.1
MAARVASHGTDRWSKRVLEWDPASSIDDLRRNARRKQARPKKRWSDDLQQFLQHAGYPNAEWLSLAKQHEIWSSLEEQFTAGEWRAKGPSS